MPPVKECIKKQCSELGSQEWPPGSGKTRRVCVPAGNRIPGNIICPRDNQHCKFDKRDYCSMLYNPCVVPDHQSYCIYHEFTKQNQEE